jgi:hypothetical protein
VEGIGIDLHPPSEATVPVQLLDAVRDSLPPADVAIAMAMTHHLEGEDVVTLIRNVSRSCRRLIILDLGRHPLPAFLFRLFVAPLVHRINALDGLRSFDWCTVSGPQEKEGLGACCHLREQSALREGSLSESFPPALNRPQTNARLLGSGNGSSPASPLEE